MQPHSIIACVELALYSVLLIPVIFCAFYYLFRRETAWLYLQAFVIAKIAGPAILVYDAQRSTRSSSTQIASQIIYQIALGPLMSATLSFINISLRTDCKKSEPLYSPLSLSNGSNKRPIILRLVHPIIMVGLVLGIIGGIDRMPESSTGVINTEKYDRGATLSKVSAAMFLFSFAAISFGVARLWKARNSLTTVSYYIFTSMPVVLPLLFLRVLYSVLGAANLDDSKHGGHTDRFNIMNGSWAIYLILGFIPQAAIMIIYIASEALAYTKLRNGIRT